MNENELGAGFRQKATDSLIRAGSLLLMVNPGLIINLLIQQRHSNTSAMKIAQRLQGKNRHRTALNVIAPRLEDDVVQGAVYNSLEATHLFATGVTNVFDYFLHSLEDYMR